MKRALIIIFLVAAGCPKKSADENTNPYHDVTPQKMKQKVEKIQQQEEERNDKRLEEMK